jgi:C4-type Zn-finger protein
MPLEVVPGDCYCPNCSSPQLMTVKDKAEMGGFRIVLESSRCTKCGYMNRNIAVDGTVVKSVGSATGRLQG